MTLWRAQVTLKHVSGLPRDNVSNTFWANTASIGFDQAEAEAIAEKVRDFYTAAPVTQQSANQVKLAPAIVNTGHEVKMTPIVEATGLDARGLAFPPVWTETFDFVGRAIPAQGAASEVALCLSFKNTSMGAVPPGQRRGRVFFGPIVQGVQETVGQIVRPTQAMREDLVAAGLALKAGLITLDADLVVYSRPYEGRPETARPGNPRGPLPALAARPGNAYPVDAFWCDNAFDTVRKRGERATSRIVG